MRAIFATGFIAIATLTSGAALAEESRITELIGGRCRFVSIDKETNEEQVKSCPGPGSYAAETRSSHTNVYLAFPYRKARAPREVIYGWSLGDKVDWRGTLEKNAFKPYAAIVRVIVRDPETMKGGGHVLATIRLDGATACVAALIDVSANKEANALAREAADAARSFDCAKDKLVEKGVSTKWTQSLLEQLRETESAR